MENPELLQCPCCGSPAIFGGLTRAYDFDLAVECTKCGINTGPVSRYGKNPEKKATQIWNRRSSDSRNKLADEFGPSPTIAEPNSGQTKCSSNPPNNWREEMKSAILDGGSTRLDDLIPLIIRAYTAEVNRRAENKMLKTGKLEGSHYAAMREINAEL